MAFRGEDLVLVIHSRNQTRTTRLMDTPHDHPLAKHLPDLLAFATGIGWAWWQGWNTHELVWSLWLSSLVVGYVSIVSGAAATARGSHAAMRDGTLPDTSASARAWLARLAMPLALFYGAFLLAFFTVHFGGFHWGHSVFLNMFFPIDGGDPLTRSPMPRPHEYLEVVKQVWWFVPLALVAERHSLFAPSAPTGEDATTGVQPLSPDARMAAPYGNVVRLHLLIFFFAFASFLGIKGAWLYLVVYAAYFFPWQLPRLRRKPVAE